MGQAFASCLRILFVALNFVCALLSLGLLGLAVYLYFAQNFHQVTDHSYRLPMFLFVLMGVGILTAVVSCLGVAAGICYSPLLLGLYATILSAVLVSEVAGILLIYIMKGQVIKFVDQGLMDLLSDYRQTKDKSAGTALDFVQSVFRCCGVNGYFDYLIEKLPASCCTTASALTCNKLWILNQYVPGCKKRFTDAVYEKHIAITLSAFAGLALIELMLVITACYLCHFVRRY